MQNELRPKWLQAIRDLLSKLLIKVAAFVWPSLHDDDVD